MAHCRALGEPTGEAWSCVLRNGLQPCLRRMGVRDNGRQRFTRAHMECHQWNTGQGRTHGGRKKFWEIDLASWWVDQSFVCFMQTGCSSKILSMYLHSDPFHFWSVLGSKPKPHSQRSLTEYILQFSLSWFIYKRRCVFEISFCPPSNLP